MDLATGAMASLLPKLFELVQEEYILQMGVKEDVESLAMELTAIQTALRKVAEVPRDQLDKQVKLWADQIRELSYEMEDVVDGFMVRVEGSDPAANMKTFKGFKKKIANFFKKSKTRHQIADKIQEIKLRVQKVTDLREKYKIDNVPSQAASSTIDPRISALLKDHTELVGIDGPRDELIKRFIGDEDDVSNTKKDLKILSISGFGGLGKTTLAKAVYDKLHEQFSRKAFVSLGQNPDLKKVVIGILLQLDDASCANATKLDDAVLIGKLRGLLEKTRYLIVIDDIWNTKFWATIKYAWVDSNRGSVIITTTRVHQVAKEITDHVYEHKPLLDDNSRKLFYKRLSIVNVKYSHDQSAKLSEKILHKCGGVPLAIITIASVLANKPREMWSEVYNSIGFGHENEIVENTGHENETVENTRKILLYSYYDLPWPLKTCLLYLRIYPEDHMIKKHTIIWKWVAEGFVCEKSTSVGLFELGERYFNELINRSMIQPVETYLRGTIYACRVHDLVLDMIHFLSKEENFVVVLGSNEHHTCPRRIAIQKRVMSEGSLMANTPMRQVRSFNATMCHLGMVPSLSYFHGLRVLALEGCTFMEGRPYHLEHLGKLLQLRYLQVSEMHIAELPSEIGNLRFLQTLILSETTITELPPSVGLLSQLKCLVVTDYLKGVSNWIGNLTSLEELALVVSLYESGPFVKELVKLTELRILQTMFFEPDAELCNAIMVCLGNLHKLQQVRLSGSCLDSAELPDYEGYVAPWNLYELSFPNLVFPKLPVWINSLRLPHLSHLDLYMETVEALDVEILGRFPELISLELKTLNAGKDISKTFYHDITGGGSFPKLRYFSGELMFRFLPGAMPRLEYLRYSVGWYDTDPARLASNIASIGNLPCLQHVDGIIHRMWKQAAPAMRHAAQIHPNRPTVQLNQLLGNPISSRHNTKRFSYNRYRHYC